MPPPGPVVQRYGYAQRRRRTPGAIVMDAVSRPPVPVNEPVRQYQPGSHERAALESKIKELAGQQAELTMTIAGRQQMPAGDLIDVVQPHNSKHVLGPHATATDVDAPAAISSAKQPAHGRRA